MIIGNKWKINSATFFSCLHGFRSVADPEFYPEEGARVPGAPFRFANDNGHDIPLLQSSFSVIGFGFYRFNRI